MAIEYRRTTSTFLNHATKALIVPIVVSLVMLYTTMGDPVTSSGQVIVWLGIIAALILFAHIQLNYMGFFKLIPSLILITCMLILPPFYMTSVPGTGAA